MPWLLQGMDTVCGKAKIDVHLNMFIWVNLLQLLWNAKLLVGIFLPHPPPTISAPCIVSPSSSLNTTICWVPPSWIFVILSPRTSLTTSYALASLTSSTSTATLTNTSLCPIYHPWLNDSKAKHMRWKFFFLMFARVMALFKANNAL